MPTPSLVTSPIETPELEVGEVYSEDVDYESANMWQSHIRSLAAKKDREKKGRVLDFDGCEATAAKAFEKKQKLKMKWHPADKARDTERVIKELELDPGIGYKIQIVMDNSVDPPPMPKTPDVSPLKPVKSLNDVLMKGAMDQAKQKKEKIEKSKSIDIEDVAKKKTTVDDELKVVDLPAVVALLATTDKENEKPNDKEMKKESSKVCCSRPTARNDIVPTYCLGCGLLTCLNTGYVSHAVAIANSMKDNKEIVLMTKEERVDWFLQVYKETDSKNGNNGIECAAKYAKRQMTYETSLFLQEEEEYAQWEAEELREDDSYVSSNYERELADEEAHY